MTNPYQLPDGNVLITFSGGRTSAFMLYKILEQNGQLPDRCKVVFANTGREMPETLDFVQQCGEQWNVKIHWLEYSSENKSRYVEVNHNQASRNGEPFEMLLFSPTVTGKQRRYVPTVVNRYCTTELKLRTIKRFLLDQGWTQWTKALGMRADEAQRVKEQRKVERWTLWYPLFDALETKKTVMQFWNNNTFDLNLFGPNGLTPKGNCDGCFLKSEATLAMMWREHPDKMKWWVGLEERMNCTFQKDRSYKELGNFVSKQSDWIFDDEAFLCQADHGECTG